MISVDEALSRVLALAAKPQPETIALSDGLGRVLLEPAIARLTQPPFDAASMDGYAFRRADQGEALNVIGEAAAGRPWQGTPRPGTAIRIFTGAPVPSGYDHVEMQENIQRDGDQITVTQMSHSANIRPQGNDFAKGSAFQPARPLTARDLGLLAAMNVAQLVVARRPVVAVLAGGDELVAPGTEPKDGQIICSNDIAVASVARLAGADAYCLPIAEDSIESLKDRFDRAKDADLIVTIGGASVGNHDLIGQVTNDLGMEQSFYKIAMRPGKPLMAGKLGTSVMLGLPGNPVSSLVCAEIFMKPLLRQMQGLAPQMIHKTAILTKDLRPEGPRQHYLRAKLEPGSDLPHITPFTDQDSALLGVMAQADALLIRPAQDEARKAGDKVEYLSLD